MFIQIKMAIVLSPAKWKNDSWYFKKDVRGKKILKFQNSSLF
ncbi:hypothetical protein NEIMUCOT_03578 [Neisseria mucosa ATCC 25996]|uniref:Uncharacterized protein n=1 Tax=Neisseria mucosa (strain ATCC 25996 / DSM 4631 / NCTC 10774 / M26) TaxID=546266 RepID=D2ZSJ6_NEIM2|nr:hypothetical protein NEIMUCOT_03578 [Neisseria mucosa ATCC 25996]